MLLSKLEIKGKPLSLNRKLHDEYLHDSVHMVSSEKFEEDILLFSTNSVEFENKSYTFNDNFNSDDDQRLCDLNMAKMFDLCCESEDIVLSEEQASYSSNFIEDISIKTFKKIYLIKFNKLILKKSLIVIITYVNSKKNVR
jgi:hypothetical protein